MKSQAEGLVKDALQDGWKFELLCEGEHLCKDNIDFNDIMEHIRSVDAVIELHMQKEGEKDDWGNLIMFNEPDEELVDFYVGGYIDKWVVKEANKEQTRLHGKRYGTITGIRKIKV
mgnify:FL=1|tara:strand:+ start:314 stop:661 length:348 start_codon:yes stop_codon:yes gene_type:complete